MCFSATASFVASGALTVGAVAVARLPKPKSAIPLSLFPAIFAFHQFIEGLLWLNERGIVPDSYRSGVVYGFMTIALVLWPILVPFSAYIMESGRLRRAIILLCLLTGLYVGITALINIIRGPVDARLVGHSFAYIINEPDVFFTLYLISVSIPFLVSSNKRLALFGVALAASCVAAIFIAAAGTFPSVWCFYAAILSLFIYLVLKYPSKGNHKIPVTSS